MTRPPDAEAVIAVRLKAQEDRDDLTCAQKAREIVEDLRVYGYKIVRVD